MTRTSSSKGAAELRAANGKFRALWAAIFVFSVVANLLMLAGPLYMLQVYDRVLPARSVPTLVALSLLLTLMFVGMGFLDYARGRLTARIGAGFQKALELRVFRASLHRGLVAPADVNARAAQGDLGAVQRAIASPVVLAFCDLPWTPFFIALIFVFHPFMGWLALGGGVVLVALALFNQASTREASRRSDIAGMEADQIANGLKAEVETVRSLGMEGAAFARWLCVRSDATDLGLRTADRSGAFSVSTKTLRMFLQSAMLGMGAWLVIQGELGAGAMIASSILLGRALAPIETVIGQWGLAARAREGWMRLSQLLEQTPPVEPRTPLPRPQARIEVSGLVVRAPGEQTPLLRGISFHAEPGQAVGVIGASGSGKTSLARALTGLWTPASGEIRLGGATLDQYDPDVLGGMIGYLPQRVSLFAGTLAENIARLSGDADPAKVVEAAQKAGAHDMILKLADGYDTQVSALGGKLSGGQVQRVGLARALYGDPVFLVLDEPNSNLDSEGTLALNTAIRGIKDRGGVVFIMAHRPAAIQECDTLLMLEAGTRRAFGPRDAVLRDTVQNHTSLVGRKGAA
ncbi:type I secretion system permease/ATPase [Falsirhodobacter sp. 20TX0035]|uniref:type I secretion system permease/ATPase n=1 Tax=Falsirhodobacter sp. 20TX0035 TaxID=3022019 RepID=UPI0023300E47|nr:type I secretion system permease/ATPase [Falsirhodobacter sp. 20TX0035]MDB6452595.1 type I secretion system permease/ATPase [Falsirhodobacter sp. 20TX0035]